MVRADSENKTRWSYYPEVGLLVERKQNEVGGMNAIAFTPTMLASHRGLDRRRLRPPTVSLGTTIAVTVFVERQTNVRRRGAMNRATQSNHSSSGSNFGVQKMITFILPTARWRVPGGIRTVVPDLTGTVSPLSSIAAPGWHS